MTKIIHYIEPRNSGKTTLANTLAKQSGVNLLIDSNSLKRNSSIILSTPFNSNNEATKYDRVIIDEYIGQYLKEDKTGRTQISKFIGRVLLSFLKKEGELILISTPEVRYTREQLILASTLGCFDGVYSQNPFSTDLVTHIREEIKGGFLTSGNVEFRQNTLRTRIDNEQDYREAVGEEHYQLSYKANFIKD